MPARNKRVLDFWDRSRELTTKNNIYRNFVRKMLLTLLKFDIGKSDLTTNSLIAKKKEICSIVIAKEDGILAGLEEFAMINEGLDIQQLKKDGDKIVKGDILLEIHGNAIKILERERISLNLLQRMSGIATLTNALVDILGENVKLAATRKTLWGPLDKKAVSIGKGLTHRLNLHDGILIKDNHLKILQMNFEKAIRFAKKNHYYVEIEVENKKEALSVARFLKSLQDNDGLNQKNSFAIMLDNIKPNEIKTIIKELKYQHLYEHLLLEASGNIKPTNLAKYGDSGVDLISMGYITNSAKILNMSQEIK